MIGRTCFPKRYRRSSLVFCDHRPDFTAENAFHRSVNVLIELPCLVTLPVYSSMYSASFCCALCFGIEAVRASFPSLCAHVSCSRLWPRDGKADPYLALAAFDLSQPSFRRIRARQASPETSDIQVERLAKRLGAGLKRLAGTGRRGRVLCHERSIRTFNPPGNAMWVGCFCAAAGKLLKEMVGARGFEPPASWSRIRLLPLTP